MNKRIKKKMLKKQEAQVQTPKGMKGYGLITGNAGLMDSGIKHYFAIGTIVKIDQTDGYTVACHDEVTELHQTVQRNHIEVY
ncbi:hypothetical protein [Viridibacillus arvi]|uniref:hypothetical protein n=1 Tax=Viridibacillus arvi TaxID=263475 RepID=UPI0034CD591A